MTLLRKIPFWLLPIIGGISLGLGWHPLNLFPLLIVGLSCLFFFSITSKKEKKRKFLWLYLGFLLFNLVSTYWLVNASLAGALAAFILNSLLMTIVWYLPIRLFKQPITRILGTIGCFILFEYAHLSHWDLSWPWLTLGYSLADFPLIIQWYSITGPLVGSIWLLGIAALFISKASKWVKMGSILLPILLSTLMYVSYPSHEDANSITIGVTQPNTDPYLERYSGQDEFIPYLDQFDELLRETDSCIKNGAELVLWPETSIPVSIHEGKMNRSRFINKLMQQNFPLIVGSMSYQPVPKKTPFSKPFGSKVGGQYESYNSAFYINGDEYSIYHKSRLVPGVEKSPFKNALSFLNDWTLDFGGNTGTLGHENAATVWKVRNAEVAPLVCYESIYPHYISEFIANGANVLTVITNDGWWGETAGYQQHFAISRIMAITFRKEIARCAYTGKSGFINSRGDVITASSYDTRTTLTRPVKILPKQSIFSKTGDLSPILAIVFILLCFVPRIKQSNF